MREKEINGWWEIVFSVAVVVLIIEIVHFVIVESDVPHIVNGRLAFGLNGSNSIYYALFAGAFVLFALLYNKKFLTPTALILLSSGALSNLFDRLIYSGSVDYINFLGLPLFNLSDFSLLLGGCLLCFQIIKKA